MAFLWLLITIPILLFVKYASAIRRFIERVQFARTLPGPSMLDLLAARKKNILDTLTEWRNEYGTVYRMWLGHHLTVIFTDPEDVRTILTSNVLLHKSTVYDLVRSWLGNGLLTNGGESWHQKRKMLTPAFHFQILSSFKEPMEECCDTLISRLGQVADGRAVDIYQYITLFALDVICETAMGVKLNAQVDEGSEFVKATQLMCHLFQLRVFSNWKRIPFLYKLTAEGRQTEETLKVLHGYTKRVIKLRRRQMDAGDTITDGDDNSKRRLAFMDSLLLAQRDNGLLTDANIQEEVDTFMFAGHDTTSSAISSAIYLLAHHPTAQNLVYEELSTFGTYEHNQSTPYLDAVIKETMRVYPPVPSISRQTREPFTIRNITLPANVVVSVNVYLLHRSPQLYPDPECFRPERFLSNDTPNPFAHVAFSAGPRNCIGQRFAMLELKCSLVRLLRAFEFAPVPGAALNMMPQMILKSVNGVRVQVRPRAGTSE